MKFRLIFTLILAVLVLGSCKSKKRVVEQRKVKVEEPKYNLVIPKTTEDYIELYKDIAMDEMRAHKIPASITLAQGILESSSGKSPLALRSNNHFGIKCHKEWSGKKTYHDDDIRNECFRVYDHPNQSYKDHSDFLTTRSRYADLFKLKEDDYVGWAKGLKKAGYATDKRYPAKLIDLIDKYGLYVYDVEVLGKPKKKKKVVYVNEDGKRVKEKKNPKQEKINVNKNAPATYTVVKGDTLYSISRRYGISVSDLKILNNLDSNLISIGQVLRIIP